MCQLNGARTVCTKTNSLACVLTCWHSRATWRGGIGNRSAAAKAVIDATSSAALLDTPAPAGTSDATSTAMLGGGPLEPDWGPLALDWGPLLSGCVTPIKAAAAGWSCARASRPPATYAAQLRPEFRRTSNLSI